MVVWLAAGKAFLKSALADSIDPGVDSIPLRDETVALIRQAQVEGRRVFLASGSDARYVDQLAARIGRISGTFGTHVGANLTGRAKAERLVAAFGERGFDYVGDSLADFPVWNRSRKVFAVTASSAFETRVLKSFPDAEVIARPRETLRNYSRALRPYQWAKNVLLFLPLLAGHDFHLASFGKASLACVCFCLAASSAYVINDLLDIPGDRDNPLKAKRPFAAGQAAVASGLVLSAVCMTAALGISLVLPLGFTGVLCVYVASTLAYSLYLKRKLLIDLIALGGLYALRVLGGLAAIEARQSQWLLMFCLFLFVSLAVAKRCAELTRRRDLGFRQVMGRGYRVEDLNILFPMGVAAAFGSVFVVALYLSSPEVVRLYAHPNRLWLICPFLLYWTNRLFIMANRSDLHEDPMIFAITDRISWLTAACIAAIIVISV